MRLLWTDLAKEQVRGIRSARLHARLRNRLRSLRQFPESGKMVPEIGRKDVREILVGVFRVGYLLTENAIVVQSVWDGRREFPRSDRAGEAVAEYGA